MIDLQADIAVIGAGFGGSLAALLLDRIGLRPVLIDRGAHPRFAIGESSTPLANLVLRGLCRTYGLPRIEPLAKYGTWRQSRPEVVCGRKRGFSYFMHTPGEAFRPDPGHANELLVAASADDLHADTHWLRADVDAFLAREVQAASLPYCDRTSVAAHAGRRGWRLEGERQGEPVHVTAAFLIDATGEGGFLARTLGFAGVPAGEAAPAARGTDLQSVPTRDTGDGGEAPSGVKARGPDGLEIRPAGRGGPGSLPAAGLRTNSRAVFGHFAGVQPWHDLLRSRGGRVEDHPFCCDHAAQHHVLEEGWMWQLRFDNGVTSAGFVLDAGRHPLDPAVSAREEWNRLMGRYPSLAAQFSRARLVQPEGGLRRSGRLQRRAEHVAGDNWALLPHTAGFIDPLHSTGIAQTLCGIERLIATLAEHWGRPTLPAELARYEETVRTELTFIDDLVYGCYAARGDFRLFAACAMLYFAAATSSEHRRLNRAAPGGAAFLCADDPGLRTAVDHAGRELKEVLREPGGTAVERFQQEVAAAVAPFNVAGLCDPGVRNMYRYTAVPTEP